MATTTNFGWETPDDTDLVKDGAAAIRTLGQSIDTSMMDLEGGTAGQILAKASNTDMDFTWVSGGGDFVKIGSTTALSSVNNQSVNDCFSAAYSSYTIVLIATTTTSNNINMRLRVGGADATGGDYRFYSNLQFSSNATQTNAGNTSTSFPGTNAGTNPTNTMTIFEVVNPFAASPTGIMVNSTNNRGSSDAYLAQHNGTHALSTSYTGFSLFTDTGNMNGSITVYGRTA